MKLLSFQPNKTKGQMGMASTSMIQTFREWATIGHPQFDPNCRADQTCPKNVQLPTPIPIADLPKPTTSISRRLCAAILSPLVSITLTSSSVALARERRNKKTIPIEDYLTSPEGLKYYDIVEGKGPVAVKGSTVQVHFDCVYRGITAVSSRESKLLAGNRIIAQPYEFKVGSPPGRERRREYVDNPNGLFSAQAAPKPPPALYFMTEGMRVGGKRSVIVPPEFGYGQKGSNEIPPGATFDLNVELLQVVALPEGNS